MRDPAYMKVKSWLTDTQSFQASFPGRSPRILQARNPLLCVRDLTPSFLKRVRDFVAADAWREDSDLGQQLQALHELFGDAILPWVPFLPGAGVFV